MEAVQSLSELFPTTAASARTKNSPDELDQDDFMALMVAQMENQDPTKPMDNFEFLSQIAQFGTVSGIQALQTGLGDLSSALLSSQALQAADLVGREVVTDSNLGTLQAEGELRAQIALPESTANVTLFVQDMHGRLVDTQPIGARPAGDFSVSWDGAGADGERLPPGRYRLSAEAQSGEHSTALNVYAHRNIESVTVDPTGTATRLNLDGGDQVGMAEIKSIF